MTESMKEDHHEFLDIIFFTPSEFEKAGGAWPIRIGRNIAKTNYHIGPRTTPYYYLLFVLEGKVHSYRTDSVTPFVPGMRSVCFHMLPMSTGQTPRIRCRKYLLLLTVHMQPSYCLELDLHPTHRTVQVYLPRRLQVPCARSWRMFANRRMERVIWDDSPDF